ncbi:thiosulfate/3-mercaptopyruvate sulfurtransferase [Sphingomonas vulcanisoli]|uniref:Thiosulfate/3-mercaptopyruvate sulfurtransferase n=1 Tax=Sphingomonas vulcanisoli TaxID=1658060 RepID=A0ABX0TSA8_9SPHN|nr:sulfurtransferase [Sphingomonas vulcanisoli]NIJ07968.1 thiosulfate/3-mercaptopyruvate sulfurtransferase [Sphingomonas vulcanisoli]
MDLLVSTQWLADHLGDPDLVILDATYHALEPEKDAAADYAAAHIPGALHLDLAQLKDGNDPVPGQAPGQAQMAARLAALGIGEGARIVIYDSAPHKTSARAWWLTQLYGLSDVALLDGGLAKWRAEGRPIETGAPSDPGGGGVPIERHSDRVRTLAEMKTLVAEGGTQILDARSAARFTGAEPDPRAGVAAGHIPGSANLPYGRLFEADGTWKRGDALASEFEAAGIDLDRPVITTCGSGVTASILLFGLALLGRDHWALYDGSWSEWGALPDTPKDVGL